MACIYSCRLVLPISATCKVSNSAKKTTTHLPKPAKLRRSSKKDELAIKSQESRGQFITGSYMASDPQLQLMMMFEDTTIVNQSAAATTTTSYEMQLILEAVGDRIEMHDNIGKQRDNWNTLLLNSINAMTLTATTMAGLSSVTDHASPIKFSSTLLFGAATTLLLVMNKIQPSQLAEEQRNATRLFKQLSREIQSMLVLRAPTQADVDETMERVIAIDRAYPLPLLGKLLEKFPNKFRSAKWWPDNRTSTLTTNKLRHNIINGWSNDLEEEMRAIVEILKTKDEDDYLRLGNIALKVNKVLAISGPVLTAVAAAASTSPSFGALTVTAGALAAAVNTLEHGGQVGMVLEMYRNCAGFFRLLSESIESTLDEKDWERRENGDLFQLKVALKLGRSLSELKDLVKTGAMPDVEQFGSKLF